ncbi:MAG TPA: Spy/CpxP family protein refolding chaperone [Gemmatimonadaceae bacterium]|nr:Spy/CpxP family protein refolding chaperone [Gemmatimonadaceae bacterium]
MLKMRSLALGALLVAGVAAISEAQVSSTPRTRDGGAYGRDRGDMGEHRGHGRKGGRGRGGLALGRDLNLTEAQRTRIAAIHQKYRPQYQSLRERARPFTEAARAARQNWDSAGFRTNTERARQVLAGGEAIRNQETAEIRAVLTAEQRTKFDARQREIAERRAKMKSERGLHRGHRKARPAPAGATS